MEEGKGRRKDGSKSDIKRENYWEEKVRHLKIGMVKKTENFLSSYINNKLSWIKNSFLGAKNLDQTFLKFDGANP